MILTARKKQVRFWVHLDNPYPSGSEAMASPGPPALKNVSVSERPPLPLQPHSQSQAHAALLRAASLFQSKPPPVSRSLSADRTQVYQLTQPPSIYRSLSADRTRNYNSIQSPPKEITPQETSVGRIQYPSLTSSSSERRLLKQSSLSSLSSQQRSSVSSSSRLSSSAAAKSTKLGNIPAPPPSPSLKPRFRRQLVKLSSVLKKLPQEYNRSGPISIPKSIIDTWDRMFFEEINTDVSVYTSGGHRLGAHSIVLMSRSPVLKFQLQEQFKTSRLAEISILGVPFQAVRCFLRFLYSSRCEQEDMEEFSLHLLVLAHSYRLPALKRVCTDSYDQGLLNTENVVDVLQVARLCDEPRLYLLCLRRILSDFKDIARSDGWRTMKESDPALEQEIVEAVIDSDIKKRERSRCFDEDRVYSQLNDTMDALIHICRDGCKSIGPHDKAWDGRKGDCSFPACKGLESLVRHFAACKLKVSGGCVHCKRMWQLLELHSRMCTLQESCKVPLCRHFKVRVGQEPNRKEEMRWKMLVCKVQSAKAASRAFSLAAVTTKLAKQVR